MESTPLDALQALLTAAGYRILFRKAEWVECLIHGDGERWHGRGESEAEALQDALSRMLPSAMGQALLAQRLATAGGEVAAPQEEAPAPVVEAKVEAKIEEPPPPPAPPPPPTPPPPPPPPPPTPPPPPPPSPPPPAGPSLDEVLTALDGISRDIEAQLGAFARLAPARQRLFMLIWICRARSLEEARPSDREVQRRIGAIARRLTELARTFWPGSVRALQITARPYDLPELRVRSQPSPKTWAAASELTDWMLDQQLAEAEKAGLDADGWADEPRAGDADPDRTLASAVATINKFAAAADADEGATVDSATGDAVLAAARKLRSVRGRVRDDVAWGTAMGHLRRLAASLGGRSAKVRDAIDPNRRPT